MAISATRSILKRWIIICSIGLAGLYPLKAESLSAGALLYWFSSRVADSWLVFSTTNRTYSVGDINLSLDKLRHFQGGGSAFIRDIRDVVQVSQNQLRGFNPIATNDSLHTWLAVQLRDRERFWFALGAFDVDLGWDYVPLATNYRLSVSYAQGEQVYNTTSNRFTVPMVLAGETIRIRVAARRGADSGQPAELFYQAPVVWVTNNIAL